MCPRRMYIREEHIIYIREEHSIYYFVGIFKIPYFVLIFFSLLWLTE